MRAFAVSVVLVAGCASSDGIGQSLLDASVLGPRLAAARESRALTEEKVDISSHWTAQDTLLVSAAGSAAVSGATLEELVLLEAAGKALEAGYRYIVPVTFKDTGVLTEYTVNRPYETTASADTRGTLSGNTYRGTTQVTATTTGGPRSGAVHLPGREVSFEMYESAPEGYRPGQYFDAIATYNALSPKAN